MKSTWKSIAKKAVAAVAEALKPKVPLTEDQLDELDYRARVNAEAAARRAERARTWNALLRGRGRWLRPTAGWLKRRPRERW